MKKVTCLSVLAAVLAIYVESAVAATSTITGGYAQSDMLGVMDKTNGFNLKYRYEQDDNLLGLISSFSYTERDRAENSTYNKGQYYSITAGPAYRLNDWTSVYGMIGFGYGKFQQTTDQHGSSHTAHTASDSDYGFSYGAGLQFNPIENVALDYSYEQSRIHNVDVGTWIASVGYRF